MKRTFSPGMACRCRGARSTKTRIETQRPMTRAGRPAPSRGARSTKTRIETFPDEVPDALVAPPRSEIHQNKD